MMGLKKPILLLCSLFISVFTFAQKDVTTIGLQFKPILSANYLNTGPQTQALNGIEFTIEPQLGYNLGVVVRRGFTDMFSFESGINYTRRTYELTIRDPEIDFSGTSDFSYVIYEIPLLGLLYIQLGDQMYMNTAFGASLDFLPSSWDSSADYFRHLSLRRSWIVPSLLTNVGFEYRTRKSGYFYFGASFHRPFSNISQANVQYEGNNRSEIVGFEINGNYLTLDLRYFFHEDPERKSRKRK